MYKNFDELIKAHINISGPTKRAVVAGACDAHTLEAVFLAEERGILTPVLVGVQEEIADQLKKMNYFERKYEIANCNKGDNPSEIAVNLIRNGEGDFIVKGKIETKDLLRPILNKETGLNKNEFITHFGLMQLDGYHKLLAISDCAVIPYPTLEEKKKIITSCTNALIKLGYSKPVVGVLCAVETVSEKMPETIDAIRLKEMSIEGLLGNCVVEGPISFDLATSKESAMIKGYNSTYAGEVDMLLVPQMVTGNVMSKIWNANPKNIMAGCLMGADIPIVLTSRSASMSEKLYSILLSTILS